MGFGRSFRGVDASGHAEKEDTGATKRGTTTPNKRGREILCRSPVTSDSDDSDDSDADDSDADNKSFLAARLP
jgi:hypothetical protein